MSYKVLKEYVIICSSCGKMIEKLANLEEYNGQYFLRTHLTKADLMSKIKSATGNRVLKAIEAGYMHPLDPLTFLGDVLDAKMIGL